jgi:hypothetical protein
MHHVSLFTDYRELSWIVTLSLQRWCKECSAQSQGPRKQALIVTRILESINEKFIVYPRILILNSSDVVREVTAKHLHNFSCQDLSIVMQSVPGHLS